MRCPVFVGDLGHANLTRQVETPPRTDRGLYQQLAPRERNPRGQKEQRGLEHGKLDQFVSVFWLSPWVAARGFPLFFAG